MGINNFNKLLKESASSALIATELSELSESKLGIDVSLYLHQFLYVKTSYRPKGIYLRKFYQLITNLRLHNIKPVFILDGPPPCEKSDTLEKRKQVQSERDSKLESLKNETGLDRGRHIIQFAQEIKDQFSLVYRQDDVSTTLSDLAFETVEKINLDPTLDSENDIKEVRKIMTSEQLETYLSLTTKEKVTPIIMLKLIHLFDLTGCEYHIAKGEADALLAKLYQDKYISAVATEDNDILLYGVSKVVKGLNTPTGWGQGKINLLNLDKLLELLGIDFKGLQIIGILAGCDYIKNLPGLGIKTAHKLVKKYPELTDQLQTELSSQMVDKFPKTARESLASLESRMVYVDSFKSTLNIFMTTPNAEISVKTDLNDNGADKVDKDSLGEFLLQHTNYTKKTLDKILQQ